MFKMVRMLMLVPAALAAPAAIQGQANGNFYCTKMVQTYTVPPGVTSLFIYMNGAHGSHPGFGAGGGAGGYVEGFVAVTPGQTLYVWVGCLASKGIAWGYGDGGKKGTTPGNWGDAGWGGGGTAVTLDAAGNEPLLVAGGGGGGGGNMTGNVGGGQGGDGGNPAGNGHSGELNPHSGGLGGSFDSRNGQDGVRGNTGSGGGGGGYFGGAAGKPGDGAGGAGGGGGGGLSFAASAVTQAAFSTSNLSKDGLLYIGPRSSGAVADADADRLHDAIDQCSASDLRPTVVIDGRDTGARNHLDVDGCTLSDHINRIASGATTHPQFVREVAELTGEYRRENLLTGDERRAVVQAARVADIPPRAGGRRHSSPDDGLTEAELDR